MAEGTKLQPLQQLLNPPAPPEPIYTCEICGTQTSAPDTYSLALHYRKPGRDIVAFQCPGEQHFACSHEHAVEAMMACLKEHIEPVHQLIQADVAARKQALAQAQAAVQASGPTQPAP